MNWWVQIFSNIIGVMKGWLDKANYEAKLNNTVEMQARKKSQDHVLEKDEDEKLISLVESGTEEERQLALDEIRKKTAS